MDTNVFKNYKTIKLDDMVNYLNEKTKDERHAFKEEAMPNGKYNHLKARKYFYKAYFPEYIPKAAEPTHLKSEAIADW